MKNQNKKLKRIQKHRKNSRPGTQIYTSGEAKKYLIIEDLDKLSASGVFEAEPVPFDTRKTCIRCTLLLLAVVWAVFLRFVHFQILLRILVLIILTLLTNHRIYWEFIYRFCTKQTVEMRWVLLRDALMLGNDRIPYETIHEISICDTEEVMKHHQPGVYLYIRTEKGTTVLLSRRTGTEKEIERSEADVISFCLLLGKTKKERVN